MDESLFMIGRRHDMILSQSTWSVLCPEIWTLFMWTQRNWEFRCHRKWSLNRQFQCKSMKNYQAQTPQNLVLTEILQKFRKMSTLEKRGCCRVSNISSRWGSECVTLGVTVLETNFFLVSVVKVLLKLQGDMLLFSLNSGLYPYRAIVGKWGNSLTFFLEILRSSYLL